MPATENSKIKIILVEDDKFLQKILATKFAKDGFDVQVASDGEEGLRKIRAERPDILLLDLIIPKITGFDVLTELHSGPKDQMPAVIVLSNLGQAEDIDRAKSLGALAFMIKADVSMGAIVQQVKDIYAVREKKTK